MPSYEQAARAKWWTMEPRGTRAGLPLGFTWTNLHPAVPKLAEPIVLRMGQRGMEADLATLKDILEAQA